MRRTFSSDIDRAVEEIGRWDHPISDELREQWIQFFEGLLELENTEFIRCVKPSDAVGDPELVVFCDASEAAYGACAYVRWRVIDGTFSSRLLMAKKRIAPKRKITIPRLKLCAAVIGSRLQKQILSEMDFKFKCVICLTDSMIVRSQVQKDSYGFRTFTANCVGEIQQNGEPSEWFWISSEENPADMTSRATDALNLSSKLWKEGPAFLKCPFEEWPVKTECNVKHGDIPDKITVNLIIEDGDGDGTSYITWLNKIIKIELFNSYERLINVTTIVLCIARIASFKVGGIQKDSECYRVAEVEWMKLVQRDLGKGWRRRFMRLGPALNSDGLIVVGERLSEGFKPPWNQSELILLPFGHRLAYLYVLMIHNKDHTIDATIARVKRRVWIPQLTRLVKKIKHQCVICRKRDKRLEQKMGSLPVERLNPSPPFYVTFIDLFGPMQIRVTVKKRVKGKAYGIIFNCGSCCGVYLDLSDAYDTDSFMLVLRRFVSVHGYPISDI